MYATITEWVEAPPARRPEARPRARWIPAVLVAAALGALWIALGGPGPRQSGSVPLLPTPALDAPEPVAPPDTLEPEVGRSVILSMPRSAREARIDAGIAAAHFLDDDRRTLQIVGVAPGRTELVLSFVGTEREMIYEVVVGPARERVSDENRASALIFALGESTTLKTQAPPRAVAVGDPEVLVAERVGEHAVKVTAIAPGVTDLVITFAEGPPHVYDVEVGR